MLTAVTKLKDAKLEKAFKKRPEHMTEEEYAYVVEYYRPDNYGEYDSDPGAPLYNNGWRSLGFSVHRDSDILERSNWEVISRDLTERFPNHVKIIGAGHWAVGWVDSLRVHLHNPITGRDLPKGYEALEAAYEWHRKLGDYPVADEDHYSDLEMKEIEEAFDNYRKEEIVELIKKHLPGLCTVDREAQRDLAEAGEDPDDLENNPELLSFDLSVPENEQFAYRLHSDAAFYFGVDQMYINDEFMESHAEEVWRETYVSPWNSDAVPPQYEPYNVNGQRLSREAQIAAGQLEFPI